ncbi:MAG: hypothetical protein LBJ87_02105 [bacterium]|jgi:hypothetical protein|nr:hypothetical protein [bacterium]
MEQADPRGVRPTCAAPSTESRTGDYESLPGLGRWPGDPHEVEIAAALGSRL